MSEDDKLKQSIASLENRIARTQEKLSAAQESGDDKAEILADSIAKLQDKLASAKEQLG
jgi:electron transport complex protein RnfC